MQADIWGGGSEILYYESIGGGENSDSKGGRKDLTLNDMGGMG